MPVILFVENNLYLKALIINVIRLMVIMSLLCSYYVVTVLLFIFIVAISLANSIAMLDNCGLNDLFLLFLHDFCMY